MKERRLSLAVAFALVAVLCAHSPGASHERPDDAPGSAAAIRKVVIPEGNEPVRVTVGEIVRISGSGPAGMVEITVRTQGPVKLVATNDIRRVVNGHNIVGATIKEFELKAQKKGQAKVVITIKNKIHNTAETKEVRIEVE